jgi:hypothetical protein
MCVAGRYNLVRSQQCMIENGQPTMRNPLILSTVLVACTVALFGCPKKAGDADAASDAALAEAEAPPIDAAEAPPIAAKNSAEIARFAAEVAVPDDDAKVMSPATVRTSPRAGSVVATLKVGTDVTKVAEYQGAFLITFPDPKDASVTLMGWVGKEGFSAWVPKKVTDAAAPVPVDAGPPPKLTCPNGLVAVIITKDPICKRKCAKDSDCKNTAAGSCQNANGQAGTVVRACVND